LNKLRSKKEEKISQLIFIMTN